MCLLLDERLLVPHERVAPRAGRRLGVAVHDGEADPAGLAALERRLEPRPRARALREHVRAPGARPAGAAEVFAEPPPRLAGAHDPFRVRHYTSLTQSRPRSEGQ